MRRIAGSLGFIDIVGIKLGMTPQQAVAAVKAFNANLKIDTINARLEPGDAPGTFKRVPLLLVAHTVGPVRNPYDPIRFDAMDGSSDVIVVEFTLPPSPPLVGQLARKVTFPQGQPVAAANVLDTLRKKFGQDTSTFPMTRVWAFDEHGKLLTRLLTQPERSCLSTNVAFDSFSYSRGIPTGGSLVQDADQVNLTTTLAGISRDKALICRPLTFAIAEGLSEATSPTTQLASITVGIASPALLYASRQATHDWLQAQHDGTANKASDAAQQRAAPSF